MRIFWGKISSKERILIKYKHTIDRYMAGSQGMVRFLILQNLVVLDVNSTLRSSFKKTTERAIFEQFLETRNLYWVNFCQPTIKFLFRN